MFLALSLFFVFSIRNLSRRFQEQTYEDLTVVQREVSEEENDANAQNAEFVRAGSQVQHQVEQVRAMVIAAYPTFL